MILLDALLFALFLVLSAMVEDLFGIVLSTTFRVLWRAPFRLCDYFAGFWLFLFSSRYREQVSRELEESTPARRAFLLTEAVLAMFTGLGLILYLLAL
jgi:hypothetical protein